MLGKLLKYEFKATSRIFLPLFGALIVVAVINRIFLNLESTTLIFIGMMLGGILIVGIFVLTLIITLQRFYKNLLTREGYLMFTLPTSADGLIWSKLIVATVWNIASLLIVLLAGRIVAGPYVDWSDVWVGFSEFLERVGVVDWTLASFILEAVVLMLSALISSILTFYACMSVSLLFNKHRVLMAFVAFLAFNTIGNILSAVAMPIVMATGFDDAFMSWPLFTQIHTGAIGMIVINIATGVIFYFLSRFMLKNKLNLE